MLALFTCEIFSKGYREMDTTCFPAVLYWQEPLRTLYGNEFCLSLMKTLLSTEGSRNWRGGINISLVVLPLLQTSDSFLGSEWNLCFLVCVLLTGGEKIPVMWNRLFKSLTRMFQFTPTSTHLRRKDNFMLHIRQNFRLFLLSWENEHFKHNIRKRPTNGWQDFNFQFYRSTPNFIYTVVLPQYCHQFLITHENKVQTMVTREISRFNLFSGNHE